MELKLSVKEQCSTEIVKGGEKAREEFRCLCILKFVLVRSLTHLIQTDAH